MPEIEKKETGSAVQAAGSVITEAVKYVSVITQMTLAGAKLLGLSESVRSTYRYIERCAAEVDQLADQMAALNVDELTQGEHHDAAAVMRGVLETAESMAAELEELSATFTHASEAHQRDYGPVNEAVEAMPVPMADAEFYSNR